VGSAKGRSDLVSFRTAYVIDDMYVIDKLALRPSTSVYVTARVTNNVRRSVTVTSEAVAISPQPRLQVTLIKIKIKISCLLGPENHVRSSLGHR
jgi:hypothetical protein